MAKAKSAQPKQCLIYVLAGKDEGLLARECEKLLDQLLEPSQRQTGLIRLDPVVPVSDVLDELRTLPFLASKRIVLIEDADDFISKNREILERYFDAPSSSGILILTVSSLPSNTNLAKKLPKFGRLIEVTTPKSWQLPDRLVEYAKEAWNKKLDKNAAHLLVDLGGENLTQLYSELDKLALYVGDEKTITPAHVEALTTHNQFYSVFAVTDALTTGNTSTALERLRRIFQTDKSAGFTIVGAFAYHFRRLFNAKVLLAKGSRPSDLVGRLKLWGNKTDAFFAQVNKLSLKQIGRTLQQLAEADYAIKTGRTEPQIAIEQFILSIPTA